MSILVKLKSPYLVKSKALKICFIGLDKAGKSSILKYLLEEKFEESLDKRTIGMEVAKFYLTGLEFIAWDIGGQRGFRETIWQSYIQGSKAVVYVIDSTDSQRINESRLELEKYVLNNPKFNSVPILLLANKQDIESALSLREVEKLLNLQGKMNNKVRLFSISCKTGFNIQEAFDWLCNEILNPETSISIPSTSHLSSMSL